MTTATKTSKLTVGLGFTPQPKDESKPIFLGLARDGAWIGDSVEDIKWISPKKARKIATQLNEIADAVEAKNADTSVLNSDTPQGSSDTK